MTTEPTATEPLGFVHHFAPGRADATPLLLLHGSRVAPGASLLAARGPVLENGRPRFFRRLAEGVFDEADIRRRAEDLANFVAAARDRYGLPAPIALGFSNGANIAAAVLLLRPEALAGAVLLRPMTPLRPPPAADLTAKPVLMLSGAMDGIVPADDAARLARHLTEAGAAVTHRVLPAGHGLSQADVGLAADWLKEPAWDGLGQVRTTG